MNIRSLALFVFISSASCLMNGSEPATIHEAAITGDLDTARRLIARNNSLVNVQDIWGGTPIHHACWHGHLAFVQLLLEQPNIQTTIQDTSNSTPLHYALKKGYNNIAELLVLHPGTQINLQDKWGNTPLMLTILTTAARRNLAIQNQFDTQIDDTQIIRFLLLHGANRNIANQHGISPRATAICRDCWHEISVPVQDMINAQLALLMGRHPRTCRFSPISFLSDDVVKQIAGYLIPLHYL